MERSKKWLHTVCPAFSVTVVLMLICGLAYPLLMIGLSYVIFPNQAKGSPVVAGGETVGVQYVGQEFTEPYFMKGRPSSVHYNTYEVGSDGEKHYLDGTPFTGVASGSYNYAPSNPALQERINADLEAFLKANPEIQRNEIPADLMTASGSGLDPHISVEAASIQLPAISEASGLSVEELEQIVSDHTTGKLFGLFGNEVVNVLEVNVDIAEAMGLVQTAK